MAQNAYCSCDIYFQFKKFCRSVISRVGDAHYHDAGGKLNNERSALLFRLLFRKIEHMRLFRVDFFYDFMKRFSSLIRYCIGILEWFRLGKS